MTNKTSLSAKSTKTAILLTLSLLIFSLLCGCNTPLDNPPDQIKIASGNEQASRINHELSKPLEVQIMGPNIRGLLGGKGGRHPAQGAEVKFEIQKPVRKAEILDDQIQITDAGGKVKVRLRLGEDFGDYYINAAITDKSGSTKHVTFRATAGIIADGSGQEGKTNSTLNEPFSLTLFDNDDKPLEGAAVRFVISGDSHGAKLIPEKAITDADGVASSYLKLGKKTGRYYVAAEVSDPAGIYNARAVNFTATAVSWAWVVISMIGGLAVFIFGLKQMSDGLLRVAGERTRSILGSLTRNRFLGVMVGALVTAMIQSSSATTVMIIGFVNAGLLSISQSISVIMGANIGTTVTAQIISFKIENVALPAITLGVVILFIARKLKSRAWGNTIIGFGMLFLGMIMMKDALTPLRYSPTFLSLLSGFDCTPTDAGVMPIIPVIWAIIIGTIMTLLVQSSSATIGLTIVMAASGLINFYTAFPLILGDNIGTTITAILASLGGNRNSKRTAAAHTIFNIFGAIYMIALLYIPYKGVPIFLHFVDVMTPGDVFSVDQENIERHIAMAHTFFNVFNTVLLISFIKLIEKTCMAIIPKSSDEKEEERQYLEPHLLSTPSLALDQSIASTAYLCETAQKAFNNAFNYFLSGSENEATKARKKERTTDRLQKDITNYMVQLSQQALTDQESKLLPILIHVVNDAERIGDHAVSIVELGVRKHDEGVKFSHEANSEMQKLFELVNTQCKHVLKAIKNRDLEAAKTASDIEKEIDQIVERYAENHVKRLETGSCEVVSGILFLDILTNFERIGDHFLNIATRARKIAKIMSGGILPQEKAEEDNS